MNVSLKVASPTCGLHDVMTYWPHQRRYTASFVLKGQLHFYDDEGNTACNIHVIIAYPNHTLIYFKQENLDFGQIQPLSQEKGFKYSTFICKNVIVRSIILQIKSFTIFMKAPVKLDSVSHRLSKHIGI